MRLNQSRTGLLSGYSHTSSDASRLLHFCANERKELHLSLHVFANTPTRVDPLLAVLTINRKIGQRTSKLGMNGDTRITGGFYPVALVKK
jgi:hypothetical protein